MECYIIDLHSIKADMRKKILNKGTLIKVAGITFLLLTAPNFAHAATGIDVGAERIYKKILGIGKWVIICKGAIDTIQSVAREDLQGAKKNFLGYFLVYAILFSFPWGMRQIELVFSEME